MPYNSHTEGLFTKYNITKSHHLYKQILLRTYYFQVKDRSNLITNIANLKEYTPTYDTRSHEKWLIPFSRTNYGHQMVANTLPRLLNSYLEAGVDIHVLTPSELICLAKTII